MDVAHPAIQVKELVKTYAGRPPVPAVRGISLEDSTGEIFGKLLVPASSESSWEWRA